MRSLKLVLAVTLLVSALVPSFAAEDLDLDAPLPVDPAITKMGKLENGLTYWIRPRKSWGNLLKPVWRSSRRWEISQEHHFLKKPFT